MLNLFKVNSTGRSIRSQIFFKIGILKNCTIFTEKSLCWSLCLITLHVFRTLLKETPSFIKRHFRWLLLYRNQNDFLCTSVFSIEWCARVDHFDRTNSQSIGICSKLAMETPCVKSFENDNKDTRPTPLTATLFWCRYCELWTGLIHSGISMLTLNKEMPSCLLGICVSTWFFSM